MTKSQLDDKITTWRRNHNFRFASLIGRWKRVL